MTQPIELDVELLQECEEHLSGLRADIPMIWEYLLDADVLERMHRRAHTVKGLVGFLGIEEVTDLASWLTETLRRLRDGEEVPSNELIAEVGVHESELTRLLADLSRSDGEGSGGEPSGEEGAGFRILEGDEPGRPADGPPPGRQGLATVDPGDDRFPECSETMQTAPLVTEFDRTTVMDLPEGPGGAAVSQAGSRAAARLDAQVEAIGRALGAVFSRFGIQRTNCGRDSVRDLTNTTGDLTVIVDPKGELGAAVFFSFDSEVADALARRIATSTLGDAGSPSPEEEAEFVRGMLGEVVSFVVRETLSAVHLPPDFSEPRFHEGRGAVLSRTPRVVRTLPVETEVGKFEVGFIPGSSLLEEPGTREGGAVRAGHRRRVVITDDSAVMRKKIERALVQGGYEVVAHASNGVEAIEEFRRHRPDLLVLDICMPVMGGLDALRVIHAEDPSARVLISSSIVDRGTVSQGFKAGAVGYITKPFKPGLLLDIVGSLFKKEEPDVSLCPIGDSASLASPTLGIYRVGQLIGEGGMARVYEGHDPGLNRKVALKVIKTEYAGDVEFVVRFLEEARAVARVNHPNVVSVYFAGSDKGKHFFAMELLPGPDLGSLVRRRGRLPVGEALNYIRQVTHGLAAAKRQGLIHCDINPSNLIFGADQEILVTDFGISRHVGARERDDDSIVIGTPGFMAPEQILQEPLDHRTDIYSLGATLYLLLTGSAPYTGSDASEIAGKHLSDPVPTLPDHPGKVDRLLGRMMAKEPGDRPTGYEPLLAEIDTLI